MLKLCSTYLFTYLLQHYSGQLYPTFFNVKNPFFNTSVTQHPLNAQPPTFSNSNGVPIVCVKLCDLKQNIFKLKPKIYVFISYRLYITDI